MDCISDPGLNKMRVLNEFVGWMSDWPILSPDHSIKNIIRVRVKPLKVTVSLSRSENMMRCRFQVDSRRRWFYLFSKVNTQQATVAMPWLQFIAHNSMLLAADPRDPDSI
ncbi:hypothetical protein Mapa_016545 [Marchantia paleacea]|nr:hypothetical protein Mapa_016545 [Marchantia paleacea]